MRKFIMCSQLSTGTNLDFAGSRYFSGNRAHIFTTGRSYDIKDDFYAYFNTCYYEVVIRGIKEK